MFFICLFSRGRGGRGRDVPYAGIRSGSTEAVLLYLLKLALIELYLPFPRAGRYFAREVSKHLRKIQLDTGWAPPPLQGNNSPPGKGRCMQAMPDPWPRQTFPQGTSSSVPQCSTSQLRIAPVRTLGQGAEQGGTAEAETCSNARPTR